MESRNNKVVVASAGSRKTTYLVELSLEKRERTTLLLAYTNNNLDQIRRYIIQSNGFIPEKITVQSWHSFILTDCIRPYQNFVYDKKRIESIYYPDDIEQFKRERRFIRKTDTEKYYLVGSQYVISEHLSEFAYICNQKSGGLVLERLEAIYDFILIDEAQDLAGYDFNLVELFLKSKISVQLVADSRQATYFTNNSNKNIKFKGENIIDLFRYWEGEQLCQIEERSQCYRANQAICDFADQLYPSLAKTESRNVKQTGHDGVFIIPSSSVSRYVDQYSPTVLRDSIKTNTCGFEARNFGQSKGQTFDRVLIFPNNPIRDFLKNGDPTILKPVTKAKFYVGITRARYSVTIVYDGDCCDSILKVANQERDGHST
jgi:DNA helicase-2/ATP-dependent DNA helicase PcrA